MKAWGSGRRRRERSLSIPNTAANEQRALAVACSICTATRGNYCLVVGSTERTSRPHRQRYVDAGVGGSR